MDIEGTQGPIDAKEAKDQILMIRDEVYAMGANDYEMPALARILENLEKGELTPEKALEEAYAIKERKSAPY